MRPSRYDAGAAASPGFQLWRLTLDWQRRITQALAPLEVTHTQFVLLACILWLETHHGAPSQAAISDAAGIEPKTTGDVLRRLEQRGLLRREIDPDDSRARLVTLTPHGGELARAAMTVVERADEAFFAERPRELRAALLSVPASHSPTKP